ncbi:hypothetical protein BO78DRAFT_27206 [Aspergillus sclerotiicarbonarius CBS 121057]|uniref:Uncharacterized protein n=1 Tax=Aspergillus sclerotiicarbonarius (strain CBS 121057 / IBT 28362) TaxID=1448318 RepID=A0A319DUI9_ASPSB|nr:hypothetical protein BO78DRAFT_27206 [Aspergillus sclerotiicarbonarius CBS 121057]
MIDGFFFLFSFFLFCFLLDACWVFCPIFFIVYFIVIFFYFLQKSSFSSPGVFFTIFKIFVAFAASRVRQANLPPSYRTSLVCQGMHCACWLDAAQKEGGKKKRTDRISYELAFLSPHSSKRNPRVSSS